MSDSKFEIIEHTFKGQHFREYAQGTVDTNKPPVLKAKQYIPKSNLEPQQGDVTIIAAVGVGLVKELAEPLFEDLVERCLEQGTRIRGIWIADTYNHGASAIENTDSIGNEPSWFDHSRDLMCMINQYAHLMPSPLFGLGHSLGGGQITYLAHLHPRLFQTLILIEPAIWTSSMWTIEKQYTIVQVRATAARLETMPSLQALQELIPKHPYYKQWDKRALERLTKYGFTPQADGSLKSTTTAHAELALLGRPNLTAVGKGGGFEDMTSEDRQLVPDIYPQHGFYAPWYRAEPNWLFQILPNLRPSVLYIVGEKSQNPKLKTNVERLARTGTEWGGSGGVKLGRVEQTVVKGGGHMLIIDKNLSVVADEASKWMQSELDVWKEVERKREASDWAKRPDEKKFMVEERLWQSYIGKTSAEDILKGKL